MIVCLDVSKQPPSHSRSASNRFPRINVPNLGATTRPVSRIPRPVKSSRTISNGLPYDRPATPVSANEAVIHLSPASLGLDSRPPTSPKSVIGPVRGHSGRRSSGSRETTPRPTVPPDEHGKMVSFPALLAAQTLQLTIQSMYLPI